MPRKDLVGNRYGRLIVLEFSHKDKWGNLKWNCLCDCGKEKVCDGWKISSGHTSSCGCIAKESFKKIHHDFTTHGMSKSREYKSWRAMLGRCYYEKDIAYARYGGKGITVYEPWKTSFEAFFADLGARPEGASLDRIDPNKNYTPDNCKWSSSIVQARNQSHRYNFTYNELTMTLGQWLAFIETNGIRSEPIGIEDEL